MSGDGLGEFLRSEVPEPSPGYWSEIEARLDAIEQEGDRHGAAGPAAGSSDGVTEDFSADRQTDAEVVRLKDMRSLEIHTPARGNRRSFLAVAAVFVLVAIGAVALLNRTETTDVGTAAPGEVNSQPAPATGETSDPVEDSQPVASAVAPADPAVGTVAPTDPEVEVLALGDERRCWASDDGLLVLDFMADGTSFEGRYSYLDSLGALSGSTDGAEPTAFYTVAWSAVGSAEETGEPIVEIEGWSLATTVDAGSFGTFELIDCATMSDTVDQLDAFIDTFPIIPG